MSSPEVFTLFKDRLAAWTTTPVLFENTDVAPPSGRGGFVYVEIFGDSYDQDTIGSPGSNEWVENGVTYLHVMVPSGTGTLKARQNAKALLALFREQPLGNLHMPEMSIGAGRPGADFPNLYAMTATIFWHRRDITVIPTP